MPTSVDEYYQQCGRAGRDGLPATCRLFHSVSDKNLLHKLFDKQKGTTFASQCELLNELVVLLEDPVHCRHWALMDYFGELPERFLCQTNCDNCQSQGKFQLTDGVTDATKVVQAVVELTDKPLKFNDLKLFLAGSKSSSVVELSHLKTFGILKNKFVPVSLLSMFLNLLIRDGVLCEQIERMLPGGIMKIRIALGPKAHNLLNNDFNISKYEKL